MDPLTIALAKGRTADSTIDLLHKTGIHFPDFTKDSRKLVFFSSDQSIKLIFVKAVDVCTYVDKGAADIGVVGKDNILESGADIYELLDLEIGKCKFSVAGPIDHPPLDEVSQLTVASKYPGVAEKFFKEKGIEVDLIKLNGSVELAPLIGMSDVIVDIVETGNTIRENGLKVMDDIEDISTRLIVNKSSFATKTKSIQYIIDQFRAGLE
ncbi:MAG TPA: ATP phosphoribosyltransferase [Candidatus Avamphibacillus intestinigallinarum]|nr:ATP phosphoribosyltransferase [Candidatus Avamphibacillus intestinigallinarum]